MPFTLEGRIRHLERDKDVCDADRKLILDFIEKKKSEGKKSSTIKTYIKGIERFCAWSDKPLKQIMKEKDEKILIKYLSYLNDVLGTKSSVFHYQMTLLLIFLYMHRLKNGHNNHDDPWFFHIIRCKRCKENNIDPATVPRPEHIKTLIKYADNARDRAIIITAFDTGARAGELMACKIKHVELTNNGSTLYLPESKTKKRTVPIIYAKEYLQEYLNTHPRADKPNADLWLSKHRGYYGNKLTYESFGAILRKVRTRAVQGGELPEHIRITPHFLRHASVCESMRLGANFETMRKVYGWNSYEMILRYTHLVPEEIMKTMRQLKGEEEVEEHKTAVFMKKKCFGCGKVYPETTHFCMKCHKPLDKTTATDLKEMSELIMNKILPVYLKEGSKGVAEKWKVK